MWEKNHESQASKLNGLYLLTVAKITARVFPTDIHKWYVGWIQCENNGKHLVASIDIRYVHGADTSTSVPQHTNTFCPFALRCVRVHKCESSKSALPDGFCFKRVAGITMVTAGHTSWFIYVAFATHTSTTHSTRTKGNALSQTLDIHHTHNHTVYQNHTHALSLPCTLARSLHCPIIYDNHRTAYDLFAWRTVLA